MKNKQTLCLVMIVRNESKVIERCLNRVKSHIDYWVIVDTGSEDNTPEIIQETLKEIPGELHYRPWVNFGVNRTESLQLAKGKADYLLLCDADEQIIFSEQFNSGSLTKEKYLLEYTNACRYSVPYLIKGNIDWRYVGVTHEYLDTDQSIESERINDINILDLKDGGHKQDKYERDIHLLEQGLVEEPENSRYKFYLANSYRDIENHEKAAEWYQKRIEDGGWIEEVTVAYENLGLCYQKLGNTQQALNCWLKGYDYNPNRAESLYHAVQQLRSEGNYYLGYQLGLLAKRIPYPANDILFIKSDIYHYWIDYELSICAFYAKDFKQGYESCRHVLLTNPHNEIIVGTTINNLRFYLESAKADTAYHIRPMVQIISDYIQKHNDLDSSYYNTLCILQNLYDA